MLASEEQDKVDYTFCEVTRFLTYHRAEMPSCLRGCDWASSKRVATNSLVQQLICIKLLSVSLFPHYFGTIGVATDAMDDRVICSATSLGLDEVLCLNCRKSLSKRMGGSKGDTNMFAHDYQSLHECATLSCRICSMVLQLAEQELAEREGWNIEQIHLSYNNPSEHDWNDNGVTCSVGLTCRVTSTSQEGNYMDSIYLPIFHLQRIFGKLLLNANFIE